MSLTHWKRALALGLLSWLVPFAISFVLFPIKRANAPLFESAMSVVIVLVGAWLARRYFVAGVPRMGEAALLGLIWLAVNLALDYPMFSYGPMRMSAAAYYSEIGAAYLLYPAFLIGAAWVPDRVKNLPASATEQMPRLGKAPGERNSIMRSGDRLRV
jgi:hypothetical protein